MKYLLLNEKNLTKQPLFWIALIAPIILFLFFGSFVWSDYKFGLNKDGYKNFIDASRLPLLFLWLTIPLVAIIAHIHRTIQTEKQISHTQEQINNTQKQISLLEEKNKPDSYYAHLKSMTEALSLIPSFKIPRAHIGTENHDELSIKYPHPLYKKIFSKSKIKDGYNTEININFTKKIESLYTEIIGTLLSIKPSMLDGDKIEHLTILEEKIYLLCKELSINFSPEEHLFIVSDPFFPGNNVDTFFSSEEEIKSIIKGVRNTIIHIYELLDINMDTFFSSETSNNFLVTYIYSEETIFGDLYPTVRRSKSYNVR